MSLSSAITIAAFALPSAGWDAEHSFPRSWDSLAAASRSSLGHQRGMGTRLCPTPATQRTDSATDVTVALWPPGWRHHRAQAGEHSVPGAGKERVHPSVPSFLWHVSQSVFCLMGCKPGNQISVERKTSLKKADFSWQKPGCRGKFGVPPASPPQLVLPRSLVAGPQGKCWGGGEVLERHNLYPTV